MRLVALLSGGIDSPVAAYIMSKAGADITLLHMDNRPYSDDRSIEKVIMMRDILEKASGKPLELFIARHGDNQSLIKERCGPYQCVMCKRTMMFVAAEFARRNGMSGIIMGDSLGQVASQTLKNIKAECVGLDFPVVRPLIGWDKLDIEAVGKEIGTYHISIMPEPPCGVVPVRPITEAEPKRILELQSKLDFFHMISSSTDSAERISGTR